MNRQQPQAENIEALILGAMLLDKECQPKVFEILKSEHFYLPKHQFIFTAMLNLNLSNEPIDTVSVYEEIKKMDKIDEIGGAVYLSRLTQDISSAVNAEYHAKIVIEKWMRRQIISSGIKAAELAYNETEDIFDITGTILQNLIEINNIFERKKGSEISVIARKVIEYIENVKSGNLSGFAVKSGFLDLDDKIIGFKKAELTIIAARPSMGKSALLLKIFKNICEDNWGAIFSLEMNDESLYTRLLSANTGIIFNSLISGNFGADKGAEIAREAQRLNKLKLYIDDTPALSITELRSKAQRLKNEYDIKIIGVDYLQLMKANGENRQQEISNISQSLKAIAKDLNIPVIALAQLNRNVEMRSDKMPQLSDLRESGAIENDADLIIFLFRPEFYGITEYDNATTENLALLNIAKQRNGVLGIVKTIFIKEIMNFENYSESFMLTSGYYDKDKDLPI